MVGANCRALQIGSAPIPLGLEKNFSRHEQTPSKYQKHEGASELEDCCNSDNDAWTLSDSFQTLPTPDQSDQKPLRPRVITIDSSWVHQVTKQLLSVALRK